MAAVLGLYAVFAGLYLLYRRVRSALPPAERAFWLANILFCCLLVLPLLDERLMGRLALFTSLPLLVLLAHLEAHTVWRPWLTRAAVIAATAMALVLALGETISARVHNANHAGVLADLEELQVRQSLGRRDLVITMTGAEHVSNWFLRVKAGVVPSLSLADFEAYDHVYVLNPVQGRLYFDGLEGLTADSEADRYLFMRRNIPRPVGAEPILRTDNIEFFALASPPEDWRFGERGEFRSYGSGPFRSHADASDWSPAPLPVEQ